MSAHAAAAGKPAPRLVESEAIPWRRRVDRRRLRRDGRVWTLWTSALIAAFALPAAALVAIEPLAAPAAAIFLAHGIAVPLIQARRGARSVLPIGAQGSVAGRRASDPGAERAALGLLGDLVDHRQRELLASAGVVVERGELGAWVIGEQGALMVRPGGRRVDCWCVRVAKPGDLPAGDRVAHLLLALREDEGGFATVANLGFSGAAWRLRRLLPEPSRPALDAARCEAREIDP